MTITYAEYFKEEVNRKKVIITNPQKEYEEIIQNNDFMKSTNKSISLTE